MSVSSPLQACAVVGFLTAVHLIFTQVETIDVRLVGDVRDRHISQGIVQVKLNDRWGHICSEGWSYEDARVVCGQLGFPDANRNFPAANGGKSTGGRIRRDVQYFMKELNCDGTESALVSCKHQGLQSEGHFCNGGPVAVTCSRKSTLDIVSRKLQHCTEALSRLISLLCDS